MFENLHEFIKTIGLNNETGVEFKLGSFTDEQINALITAVENYAIDQYEDGKADGYDEGYDGGYIDGQGDCAGSYDEGYNEGYDVGFNEGQEK